MPRKKRPAKKYVCVISDSTGSTAQRVVRATLAQFRNVEVSVDLVPEVKTVDQIKEVVAETRKRKGLIAYTLVEETLRREVATLANEAGVETVDLLGPLMTSLSVFLTAKPAQKPGLFMHPGEEHYARLDAVSFTVRHDDGMSINEVHNADLVLVGPSRTSKTPLSVYLAHTRGLRVANVPLALGVPPFDILKKLERGQIAALTMRADLLSQIRRKRLEEMGNPEIEYAQLSYVEKELHYCHEIYRSPPAWPVVDVTGKSIEELANHVCAVTVESPTSPWSRKHTK